MNVYIGTDHGGFALKEALKPWLTGLGYTVIDCGNTVLDPIDDFPDFTFAVADKVASDPNSCGIVSCRSAGGVTIAANKVKGIRCVMGVNVQDVQFNREHDNINVLAIAGEHATQEEAKAMIKVFLETPFPGEERHVRRLKKIEARELQ
jgi:ribose 5-phosphate isomerase B